MTEAEAGSKKRKANDQAGDNTKKSKTTAVNGKGGAQPSTSILFVGNLSWNVDEEWLTREFESFGELVSTRVICDRTTGRSKG